MSQIIKRKEKLNCVICLTEFKPFNQVQLTCSKECSKGLAVIRARKFRQKNKVNWTPKRKPCGVCGTIFLPTIKHGKYCSHRCLRESIRTWQKRNYSPEQKRTQRNSYYIRKYGITLNDFETMYKNQKGRCQICKRKKVIVYLEEHNGK